MRRLGLSLYTFISVLALPIACSSGAGDSGVLQGIDAGEFDSVANEPEMPSSEWAKYDNLSLASIQHKLMISVPKGTTLVVGQDKYNNFDQIASGWNADIGDIVTRYKTVGQFRKAVQAEIASAKSAANQRGAGAKLVGDDTLRASAQLGLLDNDAQSSQQNCLTPVAPRDRELKAVARVVRGNNTESSVKIYAVMRQNYKNPDVYQIWSCKSINRSPYMATKNDAEHDAKFMDCQEQGIDIASRDFNACMKSNKVEYFPTEKK